MPIDIGLRNINIVLDCYKALKEYIFFGNVLRHAREDIHLNQEDTSWYESIKKAFIIYWQK